MRGLYISLYCCEGKFLYSKGAQAESETEPILSACGAEYIGILLVVDDAEYESLDVDTLGEIVVLNQFVHCARLTKEDGDAHLEWLEKN
ncbi:MAG: hypothetical protein K2J60_16380 [Acetatifactor sp.]|nr:hypothetical protein [Acetatifactor sp.]